MSHVSYECGVCHLKNVMSHTSKSWLIWMNKSWRIWVSRFWYEWIYCHHFSHWTHSCQHFHITHSRMSPVSKVMSADSFISDMNLLTSLLTLDSFIHVWYESVYREEFSGITVSFMCDMKVSTARNLAIIQFCNTSEPKWYSGTHLRSTERNWLFCGKRPAT